MRKVPRNPWILFWMIAFSSSPYLAAQGTPTWIPAHGVSTYFQLNFLKIDQGSLYVMDELGSRDRRLRRSDDLGDNWTPVGPPFPSPENIGAMEILGSEIFLMSWRNGVWRLSSPEDTAWTRVNDGLRNIDSVNHIALSGSTLLLAAEYGFFSWSAGEAKWIPAGEAMAGYLGSGMRSITVVGTTLFVMDSYGYRYRGAPTVTGWTWSKLPFHGNLSLVRKGRYLFAAGSTVSTLKYSVFRSEDDGITWQKKAAGLPADVDFMGGPVPLAMVGNNLFVSFFDEGKVYRCDDDGETWTPYVGRPENRFVYIQILEAVGSELLAMSEDGLYRLPTGFSSIRPSTGRARTRFSLREGSRSFQYQSESPGWVRLGLFTTTGRLAMSVFQGFQAGETRVFPLAPSVRPGSYLLRIETPQRAASHVLRIE